MVYLLLTVQKSGEKTARDAENPVNNGYCKLPTSTG